MKQFYFIGIFTLISLTTFAQIKTGHFGSNKTLDGVVQPHVSHTTNKWIKLAELTINGNWNSAGITVDFFPRNPNHGDSRQQLNVQFGNNYGTGIESSYDISLVTFYGQQKTLKDVKVIHTSGAGVTNNKLSVWVQIGISWLDYVPIEVRTYGNVTYEKTNQPCFTNITETGTVYDLQSNYTMAKKDSSNGIYIPVGAGTNEDALQGGVFLNPKEDFPYRRNDDIKRFLTHYGFGFHKPMGASIKGGNGAYLAGYFGVDIFTGGLSRLHVGQTGNVGIGTTNPDQKLTVQGNVNIGGTGNAVLRVRHIEGKHYQNANYDNLFLNYRSGKDVYIGNTYNDNLKANLFVTGNVGIGTTNPKEKLAVNGNIRAKEVKVELENWPDYVFEEDYALPSLSSVKAFIVENGHLPDIPSAEEINQRK